MKKIKFLGAAILAASLIFAGCANGSDDDVDSTPDTEKVVDEKGGEGSEENGGSESGSGEEAGGEENSGEGQNSGSGESSGSGDSGSSSGGDTEAGDTDGGDTGTDNGDDDNTTDNPENVGYPVTFSESSNSYSFADGVYTITLGAAHDASDEWGNQIFITGLNEAAGIANGDKIKTTATVKADKAITTFFFKNQFHEGAPHPGIDTSTSLEADTEKTVDIYGTVYDYNETSLLVIAIRGNEANTTLTLKDVKVEKLGDYAVTSLAISPASKTIKEGETVTLQAVDQYGFEIPEARFEIVSDSSSTLSDKVLTGASVDEVVTVKATYGTFEATATITVERISVATESWGLDLTNDATNIGVLPLVNVSVWGGADTAPVVEEFAGRKAIKFTIPATYGWIGAAWQANPQEDKIDVSGYSTITITYNDSEFAEGESLTDYNVKMLGGAEIPLKGTVSDPDEDGWKTITVSLSDYANAGVSLSGVGCINFADWKVGEPIDDKGNRANPGAGALYISEVSFNPAVQK